MTLRIVVLPRCAELVSTETGSSLGCITAPLGLVYDVAPEQSDAPWTVYREEAYPRPWISWLSAEEVLMDAGDFEPHTVLATVEDARRAGVRIINGSDRGAEE